MASDLDSLRSARPSNPAPAKRSIRPRAVPFDFTGTPRRWPNTSVLQTHMTNGVNLLFPAGERFFVRSVRHFLSAIDDPKLKEEVRGFFGQEGRHAGAHERFFGALRAQGFELDAFLEQYERIAFGVLESRFSPELRLAATAALEHFTALMAGNALRDGMLADAPSEVRKLLLWHACEEIEHRAVAFDVLMKVNPSYRLRMAGLLVATLSLSTFWFLGTRMLLRQEDEATRKAARAELHGLLRGGGVARRVFWKGIRSYVSRDFHPNAWDSELDALAEKTLRALNLDSFVTGAAA